MKIRKGDSIIVTTGSNKGKTGEVLKIFPKEHRAIVSGINIRTHHKKPRIKGEKGEIVKKESPIPISNISLQDPKTKKPTRIKYEIDNKIKVRVSKKSGFKFK